MKPTELIASAGVVVKKALPPGRYSVRNGARGVSWFAVKRGRLHYRGRINKQPFRDWCATKEGAGAIARVAAGIRFSLVGRARTARRRLWRALDVATRSEGFGSAVVAEPGHFMQAMADVCYADGLPRAHIARGRLVLTPRALVMCRAQAGVFGRLMQSPALSAVDESVRTFLLEHLVIEMDAALRDASPRRPVFANDGWACIGVRLGIVWADPLWAGPYGTGHLFMYELPSRGLTRSEHKAIGQAIEKISGDVSTLSRTARDAMLRVATLRRV
jgi:hypothetical protein